MHPVVLWFVDESVLYPGLLLVSLAAALRLRCCGRMSRSLLLLTALLGALLVLASAAPIAVWGYVVWAVLAMAVLWLPEYSGMSPQIRRVAVLLLFIVSLGIGLQELHYAAIPKVSLAAGAPVYVIGDSLSAGIGAGERCWPEILGAKISEEVINLARPGATAADALAQARFVTAPMALIIIEIGGNDLLGKGDAATFSLALEQLLQKLDNGQRTLLLVELPLPPLCNAYGRAQRRLAQKYGALLLPKRVLTHVLGVGGGTLDGLHLSQTGQKEFARILAEEVFMEQAQAHK